MTIVRIRTIFFCNSTGGNMKKFFLSILVIMLGLNCANAAEPQNKPNIRSEILALLHDNTPLQPTKIFDNVYCIGSVSVAAYAITTDKGIILIDSMWDNNDAQLIEKGMAELGLNPQNIKYVFVTHGHGDHYGGANYFRTKYKAEVLMSQKDTDLMMNLNTGANSPRSPKTKVDRFIKENDTITLGSTSIKIIETPGHTEGCLSAVFPVQFRGKSHTAMFWGGTGIPNDKALQEKYLMSVQKFQKIAEENNIDIQLSAHLFDENGYENLKKAAAMQENEPNPFLIGKKGVQNYLKKLENNAKQKLAQ